MKKINLTCIIDDDPIFIYGIQRAIQQGQYCENIMIFKDGKSAYDNLKAIVDRKETLPELIILDINMPIWDGWQFLDEFVKIQVQERIVILMVSSSDHPEDIEKSKSYDQVTNFIIKPIDGERLKESIEMYF